MPNETQIVNVATIDEAEQLKNKTIKTSENTIEGIDTANLAKKTAEDAGKTFVVDAVGDWKLATVSGSGKFTDVEVLPTVGEANALYHLSKEMTSENPANAYKTGLYVWNPSTSEYGQAERLGGTAEVVCDNVTITQLDGKIQVTKGNAETNVGLKVENMHPGALSTTIPGIDTATHAKIPTELGVANALTSKVGVVTGEGMKTNNVKFGIQVVDGKRKAFITYDD